MQGLLRFLQLLAMVVWCGGLVFFAFVMAPVAFHTLPSVHLAGAVVGASLRVFDIMALVCGAVFLAATAMLFRKAPMRIRGRYEMEFLFAGVMLLGTAYIQWNIIPAMDADTLQAGGDIASAAPTNPAKIHFDKLHTRSERVEGAVMLFGLGALFLMSARARHARGLTLTATSASPPPNAAASHPSRRSPCRSPSRYTSARPPHRPMC